ESLTLLRTRDGKYALKNNTDKEILGVTLLRFKLNDYYRAVIEVRTYQYPGLEGSLDAIIRVDAMQAYPLEENRIIYDDIQPNETVTIDETVDPMDGGLVIDSYLYYDGDKLSEAKFLSYFYREILKSDR